MQWVDESVTIEVSDDMFSDSLGDARNKSVQGTINCFIGEIYILAGNYLSFIAA